MNQKLKVIVTAIISFVMVTLGTLSFAATTFSDIEGHWAKTVVEEMAAKGVLNGFEDGTFRPDESVTREQFAKILVETLKLTERTTNIKFVDVEEDRWSKDYIYRASRYLTGYENNGKYFFRPTEASVREDVAVAVVQAEGLQTEKPDYTLLNQFSDSGEISEGIKKYVAIAVKNEIMRGKDGYFDPQGNLTRAEVSQLMYNVFQKIAIGELESFSIGDVNGDGKITKEDAVLLYNYTVFPEDYASEIPYAIRRNADKYLDLDQDGNIDVVDVTILKAYVDKKITQLPHKHTYKDNVCTGCKHELTIIYGDVNGDGVVTAKDRLALTKYIQNQDEKIDVKAADLNLDGKIDIVDLMILKKHIAKWADFSKLPHDCKKPYTTEIKQKDEKEHEIVYTCGCGLSLGEVSEEHELKDGKCAKCGYEQKEIIYGDVNGDGKITSDDVTLILKYSRGETANIDKKAADVNLDGKADVADALIIMKNIFEMTGFSKLPHDCKKPYTTETKQKDENEHEIVYTCGCGLSLGEVSEEHELKDGKCAKCGYEQKEILYGDVNGDGTVDFYDVAKLNAYLKNNSTKINEKAADVNADGKITEEDATILYAYTRGEITELPHSHTKITGGKCAECGYQIVGDISKPTPTPDAELPVEPKPTPEVM